MVTNFLIGLREGLEAALIVGVLVAYLLRIGRRDLLAAAWSGFALAVGLSLLVGASLTLGERQLSPTATEAMEGILGIIAAGLMTWVVFWMARNTRYLPGRLESALGPTAGIGWGTVFSLTLVAVGREGLEMALFVWAGITTAGSTLAPLGGATLGILCAGVLGWAIYRGAIRIDLKAFFQWTGLFLIVLAAGVLAHGVHELQEAGIVGGGETRAFDVSAQIPPSSWHGTLLKGVFNFSPTPSVLEVVAWTAYLVTALVLFTRIILRPAREPATTPQAPLSDSTSPVTASNAPTR